MIADARRRTIPLAPGNNDEGDHEHSNPNFKASFSSENESLSGGERRQVARG
jgi:hypothetical protein